MAHSKSRLTPLPHVLFETNRILSKHQARLDRNERPNVHSGILPLPSSRTPGSSVSNKGNRLRKFCTGDTLEIFNGLVQIKNTIPQIENDLSELCRPDPTRGGYRYHFAVNLKDESGSIDTIVGDDAGRKLFGISASDAVNGSPSSTDTNSP